MGVICGTIYSAISAYAVDEQRGQWGVQKLKESVYIIPIRITTLYQDSVLPSFQPLQTTTPPKNLNFRPLYQMKRYTFITKSIQFASHNKWQVHVEAVHFDLMIERDSGERRVAL
jgi:hypothetical protein